jgi:CzcA family heavy metal efflux pump
MIGAIVRSSLRFRLLVVAIAAGVLAVGLVQLREAPVDVLPEFTPPYVEIQTEAPGLSANEVEQLITVPLEADLLNGVFGVDVIRSRSVPGLSSIVLVFEPGSDLYRSRQLVQERLTQAHALPNVSEPPTMLQPRSSSSRVLMIGLASDRLSPIARSVIARWTVRPRLMGVPGVANVAIWGMRDQQLQVQVDPERLRDREVTLDQVIETAGNAQVVSPLSFLEGSTPGTGGFIETPTQRLQVRNVLDRIADPKELGKVPVEGTAGRLRLSDVADVRVDHQPLIGDAVVGDRDGLLLVVEKFPGASTPEVTRGVEEALDELAPGLSGLRTDTSVFRPATLIDHAIDNLALALITAAVLLALALAAFLFRWRSVVVALATIPVSLVAAALVLDLLGQTFNAISFAGLAVALVLMIDDAVVGAENVSRRVRPRREPAERPVSGVVLEATRETRSPLMYATLIALLAIVPVAVMEGRPGAFFQPLVVTYVLAVAAATLVALTLAPALSFLLFSRGSPRGHESPLVRWLGGRYAGALSRVVRRPRAMLVAAVAAVLLALAALPLLGTSLIPSFEDRDVLVRLDGEPGTSNPRMTAIATTLGRELRGVPGVDNVGAHVGRAVTGDQVVDVNSAELWVSIDSAADHDATLARIEEAAGRTRGAQAGVVTYTAQKMSDVGALDDGDGASAGDGLNVLTGTDEPLVVRVYGQDLATLTREADRVRRLVGGVDGVVDARVEKPVTQPTIEIETDLARAQRHGVKPGDVRRAEATLLHGIRVGSIFAEQKVFDVVVQGVPATRESVASVRNLLIDGSDGGHLRLGQVADVQVAPTPIAIERDAVSRRLDVVTAVSGRGLGAVAGDIEARLASTAFPLEYHAEVLRQTTGQEVGGARMLVFAVGAAIAAFLLLQAAFRSWRLAVLAFVTLPVALVGGVLAALVDGAELSLGSFLGLLAILGLAVRTGVVLIRRFQDIEAEREGSAADLVEQGARERLAPVLASACAVAAVMLPFAVAGARPGLEIVHPMAVVVLGGLVTLALLYLFVLPALYVSAWRPPSGPAVLAAAEAPEGAPAAPDGGRRRATVPAGRFRWRRAG